MDFSGAAAIKPFLGEDISCLDARIILDPGSGRGGVQYGVQYSTQRRAAICVDLGWKQQGETLTDTDIMTIIQRLSPQITNDTHILGREDGDTYHGRCRPAQGAAGLRDALRPHPGRLPRAGHHPRRSVPVPVPSV